MFTITGENYESKIYADCRCKSTDEKRTDGRGRIQTLTS